MQGGSIRCHEIKENINFSIQTNLKTESPCIKKTTKSKHNSFSIDKTPLSIFVNQLTLSGIKRFDCSILLH